MNLLQHPEPYWPPSSCYNVCSVYVVLRPDCGQHDFMREHWTSCPTLTPVKPVCLCFCSDEAGHYISLKWKISFTYLSNSPHLLYFGLYKSFERSNSTCRLILFNLNSVNCHLFKTNQLLTQPFGSYRTCPFWCQLWGLSTVKSQRCVPNI